MVKVLAIGDVHFKVTNIPEVNLFIERITELAKKECPDFIVVLGDVLDTHEKIHGIPLNKAKEFIDAMRSISYTYVLVGNHDYQSNVQFLNSNHWMNILKYWENVEIADTVLSCENGGEFFVFSPYVSPGRFVEALDTMGDSWKGAACVFAHQEFYGCKMGAVVSIDGDRWPEDYPRVVSGHIHSKDNLQGNLYYTGSAMQHAFGESEKNTVAVLDFDMGSYSCREVDLLLPRKKTISISLEKIMDFEIPETEDKIMLSISEVNPEAFKSFQKSKKYKELQRAGIKLKFNQKRSDSLVEVNKEAVDSGGGFKEILHELVQREKNSYLTSVYENIIHRKNVREEDIIYI